MEVGRTLEDYAFDDKKVLYVGRKAVVTQEEKGITWLQLMCCHIVFWGYY